MKHQPPKTRTFARFWATFAVQLWPLLFWDFVQRGFHSWLPIPKPTLSSIPEDQWSFCCVSLIFRNWNTDTLANEL
jgi:hypothetical protein